MWVSFSKRILPCFLVFSLPFQRVSVVDMDPDGINDLLASHGFFKRAAEPEPEPEEEEEEELPQEAEREEL